jgi:ribosomal protein S18 acetylase RimI-like enzyme
VTRVRVARREEFTDILEIWKRHRGPAASVPDDETTLTVLLASDRDSLLVAEESGAIVGTLIAAWDGWRGNMYRLVVVPEHRRRGVALQLVRAGEEHVQAKGARRISAIVAADDVAAIAAWRTAGYTLDGKVRRLVRNP